MAVRKRQHRYLLTLLLVCSASAAHEGTPIIQFGPIDPSAFHAVEPPLVMLVRQKRKKPLVEWVTPRTPPSAEFINATEAPGDKQILPGTITVEIDGLQYDDMGSVLYNSAEKSIRIVSLFDNMDCASQGNSQNLPPLVPYAIIDFEVMLLASLGSDPMSGTDVFMQLEPTDDNGPNDGPGPVVRLRSVHGDVLCGTPDRVVPLFGDGFE